MVCAGIFWIANISANRKKDGGGRVENYIARNSKWQPTSRSRCVEFISMLVNKVSITFSTLLIPRIQLRYKNLLDVKVVVIVFIFEGFRPPFVHDHLRVRITNNELETLSREVLVPLKEKFKTGATHFVICSGEQFTIVESNNYW